MAMNARELRNSLIRLQKDLQAAMPNSSGELVDTVGMGVLNALLVEVATSYPDHPVVKALQAEPLQELRVREALLVVGQLVEVVPQTPIGIA